MRLQFCRTLAVVAIAVLAGAAHAEVRVSTANDPSSLITEQFSSLFATEHEAINAQPEKRLSALANGTLGQKAKAGEVVPELSYTEAYLATLPEAAGDGEWDCLRRALYFEARGESVEGQFAVAEVILNRVESPDFPGTICGVVNAKGQGACAFSFVCDGLRSMGDAAARERAGKIARLMLDGAPRDLTDGATYFHARYVNPNWDHVVKTTAIGQHLFYR